MLKVTALSDFFICYYCAGDLHRVGGAEKNFTCDKNCEDSRCDKQNFK